MQPGNAAAQPLQQVQRFHFANRHPHLGAPQAARMARIPPLYTG